MEERLLDFLKQVFTLLGWPGVVFLMGLESAGLPVPSEAVMPLSGWMLVKERGLPVAYLLLAGFYGALGNLWGSALAYWIGLKGGRPLLEKYGRYLLITPNDIAVVDRWFLKYGYATVFFSRLLPVVRTFVSFPAGFARVPLGRFLLYTLLGAYPWNLGLAYGGFLLGENWEQLRRAMRPFDIPILLFFLAFAAYFVYRRLRHLKKLA